MYGELLPDIPSARAPLFPPKQDTLVTVSITVGMWLQFESTILIMKSNVSPDPKLVQAFGAPFVLNSFLLRIRIPVAPREALTGTVIYARPLLVVVDTCTHSPLGVEDVLLVASKVPLWSKSIQTEDIVRPVKC